LHRYGSGQVCDRVGAGEPLPAGLAVADITHDKRL
jgi:hypothetical protein